MENKSVEKKEESFFMKNLTRSGSDIKKTRARQFCGSAKDTYTDIILQLRKRRRELRNQILSLEDLAPRSVTSLVPVDGDFNAVKWCAEVQNLSLDIKEVEEQLQVAIDNYNRYFTVNENEKIVLEDE